ncbi:MAG: hypothetical protein ACE5HL_11160 [Terriglobia bacterium]
MNQTLNEIAEFTGKACGTIVKDLAEISPPMTEAFRRGWREAMQDKPKTAPAPAASNSAPESA